jgi:hypothetical protein
VESTFGSDALGSEYGLHVGSRIGAMLWARKTIGPTDWGTTQDQFEELFVKLGGPKQMMLVAASDPASGQPIFLMSLPSTTFLGTFSGFERVMEGDLPSEAALLVGHNDEMKKHFSYPVRKPSP